MLKSPIWRMGMVASFHGFTLVQVQQKYTAK